MTAVRKRWSAPLGRAWGFTIVAVLIVLGVTVAIAVAIAVASMPLLPLNVVDFGKDVNFEIIGTLKFTLWAEKNRWRVQTRFLPSTIIVRVTSTIWFIVIVRNNWRLCISLEAAWSIVGQN
jgi:hypothetical protein